MTSGSGLNPSALELIDGDIHVTSQAGRGSCFQLEITVLKAQGTEVEQASPRWAPAGVKSGLGPFRILIVDDNAENRQLLMEMLDLEGLDLEEVADGEQALVVCERWAPHLVRMDLRMSVMDGYEATQRIKASLPGRNLPVLALTASVLDLDRQKLVESGLDGYISIEKAVTYAPQVAARLRVLADNYEYDALLQLFTEERRA